MWRWIKEWYKRNRVPFAIFLGASMGIGLLIAAVCLFSPAALAAFATLTLGGVTPLSFLTAIHLPLALLALAAITSGVAFGAITIGVLVMKQFTTIGRHLWALHGGEKQPQTNPLTSGTYHYLQAHLHGTDSYMEEYDEEYNEINSSNSSDEEEQEGSICSSDFIDPDNPVESIPYSFSPSLR
ncbi:hypothetical protein [Legionella maioricensis]|uniref:Uncharacterized protein n=1 Tax=Legionella maioricensis TaxID=2896528 RepID=A0A9X2IB06_9GAMM|nr:hypothetical protein [Legionella maioricensis]MCL9682987.1 hypothetical protein [Legionella maioricensis]MCL9686335.1 hypothetical protein [Legionella maioricensis]